MEFERINDDTIRVIITKRDLDDRGVSITDLLGNQEEIEQFFYGILEEADVDYEFLNKGDGAVSFQVLPSKNGLEVYISNHMPDQETMDGLVQSAAKRATEAIDDDQTDVVSNELLDKLLAADVTDDEENQANPASRLTALDETTDGKADNAPGHIFLRFNDFEDVIALAQVIKQGIDNAILYQDQGHYYLDLIFQEDVSRVDRQNLLSIALEYAKISPVDADVLAEHGQVIFDSHALEQLAKYFQ